MSETNLTSVKREVRCSCCNSLLCTKERDGSILVKRGNVEITTQGPTEIKCSRGTRTQVSNEVSATYFTSGGSLVTERA